MNILRIIMRILGISQINLDKPLSLLGIYYPNVYEKINRLGYSIYDEVDRGLYYYRNDEVDPDMLICQWESIKIISTIIHDDNDIIFRAGKIYIDKDKNFIDEIISGITSGKKQIQRKFYDPHYEADELDSYYHYSDNVSLKVRKEYDKFERNWKAEIEYILKNPSKTKSPLPHRRTLQVDRNRIIHDIKTNVR